MLLPRKRASLPLTSQAREAKRPAAAWFGYSRGARRQTRGLAKSVVWVVARSD